MKNEHPFQSWIDYQEMVFSWRGKIINHAIDVEHTMETFIARHFVKDAKTPEEFESKANDFKRIFFWNTQMGLGTKKQICVKVITLHSPLFLQTHPDVEQELEKIVSCRNAMAHWQLDFSQHYRWFGAANKTFKVNKLSTVTTVIHSEASINTIIDLCQRYTAAFLFWYP